MDIYNPDYYRTGKIEVADFIEDKGFNFFLGNVIKYVSRAGMKKDNSTVQDLKKAQWYLNREIKRLESDDGLTTTFLNDLIHSNLESGCTSCKPKCAPPTSGSNIKKSKKKIELEFGSRVKGNTVEYMSDMSDDEYADTVSTVTNIIFGDDDDDYPYTDEDFEWDDSDDEETVMTRSRIPKRKRRSNKNED